MVSTLHLSLGGGVALVLAVVVAFPALVWSIVCKGLLFLLVLVAICVPAAAVGVCLIAQKPPPKPFIASQNALGNTLRYWAALLKDEGIQVFGSPAEVDKGKERDDDEQGMALRRARLQVWQVRLVFQLWDAKHYRCQSFSQDIRDNLRNLAFPGTVLPLSLWVSFRWSAWVFALVVNPLACLFAALAVLICDKQVKDPLSNIPAFFKAVAVEYQKQLLTPEDWFSLWRLNCAVVALHDNTLKDQVRADYDMESKWDFLVRAAEKGVACSPCVGLGKLAKLGKELGAEIVAKDKNCEGGMGIHFLKNACDGGDWILQPRLNNAKELEKILPKSAPLSTMRILTASCVGIPQDDQCRRGRERITPLTVVFRAGRAGAQTDHSAIFYNVDMKTGKITRGGSNAHWYEVGIKKVTSEKKAGSWTKNGVFLGEGFAARREAQGTHPDTGVDLVGKEIPQLKESLELCKRAHEELCPHVPLAGWDVVLVDEEDEVGAGKIRVVPLLLEVNLSCNFFLGSFDEPWYFRFCEDWVRFLEEAETARRTSIQFTKKPTP